MMRIARPSPDNGAPRRRCPPDQSCRSPRRSAAQTPRGLRTAAALIAPVLLVSLAALPRPAAGQAAAPVSRAEFNQWMQDISNWGRWGPEDELGTLNLITDETRQAAARLVEDGVSVSMALDLNTERDALNANPSTSWSSWGWECRCLTTSIWTRSRPRRPGAAAGSSSSWERRCGFEEAPDRR